MRGGSVPVARVVMKNTYATLVVGAALLAVAAPALGDEEMLQPGQSFPSFELPAHDGTTVSSSDLEGTPYLLFFYPKANTGG